MNERQHITFDGPDGLRYDPRIHDYIDEDGTLASPERVAAAWGTTVEEVEAERKAREETRSER